MPRPPILLLVLAATALGAFLLGCKSSKPEATPAATRVAYQPIPASLTADLSGQKALDHIEKIVAFGPRPPASPGYEKTLVYLEQTLASLGWQTKRQTFRPSTPIGRVSFTNLLARFPHNPPIDWTTSPPAILSGHIDSKRLSFPFVGANDGGSSTGILLEIARVLATDPAAASRFEIVFFDGEEAMLPNITASDGLYGSKYYANQISRRSTWPAFGVVLDLVGDPKVPLQYNPETPADFAAAVTGYAQSTDFPTLLVPAPGPIIDDHVPLQNTGLPCLHLIGDFQAMPYWHQPGDTLDTLSPAMLEAVGRMTLDFLSKVSRPTPE